MTAYILSAAGAVFLTVVVSMIMPEGKLSKAVGFVLRIVCIAVLISPIFSLFKITSDGGEGDMIDYEYVAEIFSDSQSRTLEGMLYEEFGLECDCEVSVSFEDGELKESGVEVEVQDVEKELIDDIVAYLKEVGYININVHEKIH